MNDLLKIFEDNSVELSEDAKEKMTTLWEAKVAELKSDYEEKLQKKIDEEIVPQYEEKTQEYIDNVIMENVNSYVTEAVKELTKKHEKELSSYAVSETNEHILGKLKEVFESMSVKVPEGKEDVLEAAEKRAKELEEKVNALLESQAESQKTITELKREKIVDQVSEGLSDLQKEKLDELLENVMTEDMEAFERKAKILRESVENKKEVEEEDDEDDGKENKEKEIKESSYKNDPYLSRLVESVNKQ